MGHEEFTIRPLEGVCCSACGQAIIKQSPRQTQLNSAVFVSKRHPRIRLRGQIDSLHALVLMAANRANDSSSEWLNAALESVAGYCREMVSAEYNERRVAPLTMDGKSARQLHAASHNPASLGVDHILLDSSSSEMLHWLNLIRTKSREVELAALDAFEADVEGYGASVVEALNVLSSAVYYLQLKCVASGASARSE